MRRKEELQIDDQGFWEVKRDCLDDLKSGERLQMQTNLSFYLALTHLLRRTTYAF